MKSSHGLYPSIPDSTKLRSIVGFFISWCRFKIDDITFQIELLTGDCCEQSTKKNEELYLYACNTFVQIQDKV